MPGAARHQSPGADQPTPVRATLSNMPRKVLFLLGLLTVVSTLLAVFMLNRDHGWGDDFAAYIMQAQSIVGGKMQEYVASNAFTMTQASRVIGPVTYPWGFPLLLAPVFAVFGLKVLALKLVSSVSYALFLVAFFLLARARLRDREALLLTAVLGFNPTLLLAQNDILADIPFLLFSTLGLWLTEMFVNEGARDRMGVGQGVAVGCAVFLAIFMRANGYLLLLALMTAQGMQFFRRFRDHRGLQLGDLSAVIPYATVALLYLVQAWVFPTVAYQLHESFRGLSVTSIWRNLQFYFWLPKDMFTDLLQGGSLIYLMLLVGFSVKLWHWRPRDLPMLMYGLGTLVLYMLWPPVQGLRFIFPLLPIFILFSFEGMQIVAGFLKPIHRERGQAFVFDLWAGLALFSLAACIQLGWTNMAANRYVDGRSYGAFSPGSTAMFEYVRAKTPVDSVIIFFKPRAMRLRTDRDTFSTTKCQDLAKGDYVAIVKSNSGLDQIPPAQVHHCNPALTLTPFYEKDDFIIYRIAAAP
jgi:hypothetical protein